MHLTRIQAKKESIPGLNYDLVITIDLADDFLKKKKEERKIGRRYFPIINQEMHVDQEDGRLPDI